MKPTIMQIIPRLDTGGAELSTIEITDAVVCAGGRMLVASEGGRLAQELAKAGGELIEFPAGSKNPARIIANGHRLAGLIRASGVNLIHARSRAPAWSALMAARRTGIPFVTTYHGAYSESGWLKNRYNSVMARGDLVIANSRYTAGLIASRYGTEGARLRVIYRGVDVDGFDPALVAPARIARLRQAWGVAEDDRIILQAARMTRWKGHGVVISAVDQLVRQGRLGADQERALGQAVVVMAGDAQGRESYMQELQLDIASRGLQDKIRLVGHCNDMPAAFAAAHVAVVGSDGTTPEAFGRAAAEAQAAACPVIAADFGAPPETVLAPHRVPGDKITGWLVPPNDAKSLAASLCEVLDLDDAARLQLGQRARRHILDNFDDEAMKRQTLGVYDQLLATTLTARFDATVPAPER